MCPRVASIGKCRAPRVNDDSLSARHCTTECIYSIYPGTKVCGSSAGHRSLRIRRQAAQSRRRSSPAAAGCSLQRSAGPFAYRSRGMLCLLCAFPVFRIAGFRRKSSDLDGFWLFSRKGKIRHVELAASCGGYVHYGSCRTTGSDVSAAGDLNVESA